MTPAFIPLPEAGTHTDTTPVPADTSWADTAWATLTTHTTAIGYGTAATLAVLLAMSIRNRRTRTPATGASTGDKQQDMTRTDRAITRITALIATAVLATGMWKVFGDVLHFHWAIRLALFAFAEAQLIAAFRRARRHLYRHGTLGKSAWAIYAIAFGSALIAVFDAGSLVEVAFRLFAAAVAAYMIGEELAEERDILLTANPDKYAAAVKTRKTRRINWTFTPERVLVWLGLAEPSEREVADVERQRRIARFARTAFRLQLLKETGAWQWRVQMAVRSLRRQAEAANEHLSLATDRAAMDKVRAHLAFLYQVEQGTSRTAVADLSPFRPAPRLAIAASPFVPDTSSGHPVRSVSVMVTGQPADTTTGHGPDMSAGHQADTTPDTTTGHPADTLAGSATDTPADTAPDTVTAPAADTQPDTTTRRPSPPRRTPRRTSHRTPKWTKEQLKAFRLRDNDPDMTYPMIAREVGVSEKTVSRWFKARDNAEQTTPTAESVRPELPLVPVIQLPVPEAKKPVSAGVNGNPYPTTKEN